MGTTAAALSLSLLREEAERRAFAARFGMPSRADFAALADRVAAEARLHPGEAASLAEALLAWALASADPHAAALARRAQGNVAFLAGDYARAVASYRAALDGFGSDDLERGRTLSSLLHPLAMLGEAGESRRAADEARACFERCGATYRLARLDVNLASVFFREDRFADALAAVERAAQGLQATPEGRADTEAWAAVRLTRAVTLIGLARFDEAETAFQAARDFALAQGMPSLAAQADYNIGYLYFLRGRHLKAIRALDRARETAIAQDDKLHRALCDLDQADVCIELKLYEDALRLAHAALGQFQAMGLGYEQGKALTNMAVAEQFLGHDSVALELLGQAEAAFAAAGSDFWVQMARLYRSAVLLQLGRCFEALPLCEGARAFFTSGRAPTKAAYAAILAARACLAALEVPAARAALAQAAALLGDLHAPWLRVQIEALRAQLAEQAGEPAAALAAWEAAMAQNEAARSHINFDELRVSLTRDKSRLYQRYLDLLLETAPPPEAVWRHVERAKSRALAVLLAGGLGVMQPAESGGSRVVSEIGRLREELNWYYRQLDPGRPEPSAGPAPVAKVLAAIEQRENELLRAVRNLAGDEYRLFEPERGVGLDHFRAALGSASAAFVEYFPAGAGYVALVGDERDLRVVRLPGERSAIESAIRLLRFQVGRRAMESAHFHRHAAAFQHAAESHLGLLHRLLLAPLEPWLGRPHLVFLPHGVLHGVPFAALAASHGGEPLLLRHRVSLAPSAAVLVQGGQTRGSAPIHALLVAADPAAAPAESRAAAAAFPGAQSLLGPAATLEAVRRAAPSSRILHISARGLRGDNPYFRALELADGPLNVVDICHLRLDADLVVLSGCGLALGELAGGEEVIGLARAFLYAGARAVLSTLWEVDDRVSAACLEAFCRRWRGAGGSLSAPEALRQSQLELRQRHPHPFFWAPFQLLGAAAEPAA